MSVRKHIYFVRHGESTANASGIREGEESLLTEGGIAQAETVAQRFQDIPVEVVLSSTYPRARDTGKRIADMKKIPFELIEHAHERELPKDVIGKHRDDPQVQQAIAQFEYNWIHDIRNEGGEHFDDLKKRAASISALLKERKEEHIAVSTHGFFMVFLAGYHLLGDYFTPDLFVNSFMRSMHINNTGITHFVVKDDGEWVLVSWNDSAHLGVLGS